MTFFWTWRLRGPWKQLEHLLAILSHGGRRGQGLIGLGLGPGRPSRSSGGHFLLPDPYNITCRARADLAPPQTHHQTLLVLPAASGFLEWAGSTRGAPSAGPRDVSFPKGMPGSGAGAPAEPMRAHSLGRTGLCEIRGGQVNTLRWRSGLAAPKTAGGNGRD